MARNGIRPPRDGLVRVAQPSADAIELRDAGEGEAMPVLHGHFARFGEWTEIDSHFEGRFLERIAPGAFTKTLRESRDSIKVLFQHGTDPQVGDKPLGPIRDVGEDEVGAFYEVPLLDTDYNRNLIPGIEAGLYGASFRFRVVKEQIEDEPERSDDNPDRIPQRTIQEAQVFEFGPVTFPAYSGATAGVRSWTDELVATRMAQDAPDHLLTILLRAADEDEAAEPEPVEAGDAPHSADKEPETPTPEPKEAGSRIPIYGHQEAKPTWRI